MDGQKRDESARPHARIRGDANRDGTRRDLTGREPSGRKLSGRELSGRELSRREFARRAGVGSAAAAGLVWAAPKISTVKYVRKAAVGSSGPTGTTEPAPPVGPLGNRLSISSTSPCVGDSLHVVADGFAPSSGVAIQIDDASTAIGMTSADLTGGIDVTVQLPNDGPTGSHTLRAVGTQPGGKALVLTAAIVIKTAAECVAAETVAGTPGATDPNAAVEGANTGSGGGALPFTGGMTTDLTLMGGAAVLGGAALREIARRSAPVDEPGR